MAAASTSVRRFHILAYRLQPTEPMETVGQFEYCPILLEVTAFGEAAAGSGRQLAIMYGPPPDCKRF